MEGAYIHTQTRRMACVIAIRSAVSASIAYGGNCSRVYVSAKESGGDSD